MTNPALTELGALLPRHLFLEPLLAGARVLELGATATGSATALHDRGAASVVTLDTDAEAIDEARRIHGGPGLRYVCGTLSSLGAASFDLVVSHDALCLDSLDEVTRVLAPGGRLALATDHGGYRAAAAALSAAFPAVEVATIRAVAGWAMAPVQVPGAPVAIDELGGEPASASQFVFLCGRAPLKVATQRIAILPQREVPELERLLAREAVGLSDEIDALRAAEALLQDENEAQRAAESRLQDDNDALRAAESRLQDDKDALRAAEARLREANDELRDREAGLRAEIDALRAENTSLREQLERADDREDELSALEAEAARARASAKGLRDELAALHAGAPPNVVLSETLARRTRDAEERAEAEALRAREAEDAMREAARRAEIAEGRSAGNHPEDERARREAMLVRMALLRSRSRAE